MGKLIWERDEDEDGNTTWESQSPYHDGDSSHFMFRLRQALRSNRIEWESASDEECGGDMDGPWLTIEEAKDACETARDTIVRLLDTE